MTVLAFLEGWAGLYGSNSDYCTRVEFAMGLPKCHRSLQSSITLPCNPPKKLTKRNVYLSLEPWKQQKLPRIEKTSCTWLKERSKQSAWLDWIVRMLSYQRKITSVLILALCGTVTWHERVHGLVATGNIIISQPLEAYNLMRRTVSLVD